MGCFNSGPPQPNQTPPIYVSPQDRARARPLPPQMAPGATGSGFGPATDAARQQYNYQTQGGPLQQAAEAETAANRPDQNTPFGSSGWSQDPATGKWTQNTQLSPELQAVLQAMTGQAGGAWNSPLDNGAQARQHAEDAIYGRETSRLDPQWQQRDHDLQVQLANQGIDPNSQAYATAYANQGRARNDAYQQAQYGAITGGGQEASRQQAMDLASRFAPLQGLQALQALLRMPNVPPSASLTGAARDQAMLNEQQRQRDEDRQRQYWEGLMRMAGAGVGAGGGGGGGGAPSAPPTDWSRYT